MSRVDEVLLRETAGRMETETLERYVRNLANNCAQGRDGLPMAGVAPLDRLRIYAQELERRNERDRQSS